MNIERDRLHFERWSRTYERSLAQPFFFDRVHAAVLRAAAGELPAPRDLLDVGCGTGRLLAHAAESFPEANLVGVDAARGMVEEARRVRGQTRLRFEEGSAEKLPFGDESFDLVLSTVSFHHWSDRAAGVREVARLLRPGGLFVLADLRMPLPARLLTPRFPAERARRRLFEGAGLRMVRQTRPLAVARVVLVTIGRK